MIVLADRHFPVAALLAAVADTGADVLIPGKKVRKLSVCARLHDGSYVSRLGQVEVPISIDIFTATGPLPPHHR